MRASLLCSERNTPPRGADEDVLLHHPVPVPEHCLGEDLAAELQLTPQSHQLLVDPDEIPDSRVIVAHTLFRVGCHILKTDPRIAREIFVAGAALLESIPVDDIFFLDDWSPALGMERPWPELKCLDCGRPLSFPARRCQRCKERRERRTD